MEPVLDLIRGFDGVLELAPSAGSEFPEIAWGDHFFYYAPDGQVPQREQPFATVVTKDYPDDASSRLDPPDRWRLNIHVGRARFVELVGGEPDRDWTADDTIDFAVADTVVPHPVYARQAWVSVVNPGTPTAELVADLLRHAYADAVRRTTRRS